MDSLHLREALFGGQPKYQLIARQLIDQVESGRIEVGSLLPTEMQLCEQYDVSRYTVRQALALLKERGMIVRAKGVGTKVVAKPRRQEAYVHSINSLNELMQYGGETELKLLSVTDKRTDELESTLLQGQAGQQWLVIEGIRTLIAGGSTDSWTQIFVNGLYGGIREDLDARRTLMLELIQNRYGVTCVEITQEIRCVRVAPSVARALGVRGQSPAMQFVRRYFDADRQIIMTSVSVHPGETHTYRMSLFRQ